MSNHGTGLSTLQNSSIALSFKKNLGIAGAAILIQGCATGPSIHKTPAAPIPSALAHLPSDVSLDIPVDSQLALSERNVYLNNLGTIKLISRQSCPIEISGHRGDFRYPESSQDAIIASNHNGFDGAEIDIIKLGDGTWVNYHDSYTGRAAVHVTGKRMNISRMDINDWVGLRVRDKDTHELLKERPLTAMEAFKTFAKTRRPGQQLNVEIKGKANGGDLQEIDYILGKYVGLGNYHYSSMDPDILEKLRGINSGVYLGFVQRPSTISISVARRDLQKIATNDSYYQERRNTIDRFADIGEWAYRKWGYKNYATISGLAKIREILGSNSGLHLDIRTFATIPRIKTIAQNSGMLIKTYSINGAKYHEDKLVSLKNKGNSLPHGVISDSSPYRLCEILYDVSKRAGHSQHATEAGRYIASLPSDADLERLSESIDYMSSGYYFSLSGKLRRIASATTIRTQSRMSKISVPEDIKDEEMTLESGKSIYIQVK